MATFTGNQYPNVAQNNLGGVVHSAVGRVDVTVNPVDNDIYRLVTIPAGAIIMSAEFWVGGLDTNDNETLDIDFGWASNGGSTETYTASDGTVYTNAFGTGTPDGFVNAGVHVEEGNYDSATATNFVLTGFKYASRDTTIQAECNATAATFAAGPISCRIDYMIVKF
jgi:hypothetical protein